MEGSNSRPLHAYESAVIKYCHATNGPLIAGSVGPSTANFAAIDGPAGLSAMTTIGMVWLDYQIVPHYRPKTDKFVSAWRVWLNQ